MNTRKLLMGTLAGGITAFILGWLIYGMLLTDFMAEHYTLPMKEQPDFILLFLAHLFWGALLTFIFLKWANISTFGGGAQAGVIIGLLFALWYNLTGLGIGTYMTVTGAVVDVLVSVVMWGLIGGVVGMVLGMGKD